VVDVEAVDTQHVWPSPPQVVVVLVQVGAAGVVVTSQVGLVAVLEASESQTAAPVTHATP
jgi:hypothetical protein